MEITKETIYQLLKSLAPKPEEVEVSIEDLPKLMGKVKGSEEALAHFSKASESFGYPIKRVEKINCGTWKCNIVWDVRDVGSLISYKSAWLYKFGDIFKRPEKVGTGLNKVIAEYCEHLGVENFIVVVPNGNIYQYSIKALLEYGKKFGTERAEQGGIEVHIPLEELNLFTAGVGSDVKPFIMEKTQPVKVAQ